MKIDLDIVPVEMYNMLIIDRNEHMQRFWTNGNLYESEMLEVIKNNYSGGTFIDIGACMGNHTLVFSSIAKKVVAFEPISENFFHMYMNLFLNKVQNIETHMVALGSSNGVKPIYRDATSYSSGSASFITKEKNIIKRFVPIAKLDDFEIDDVKLIKIDVEDYNIPVLEGALETIEKYLPDIYIECATQEIFQATYSLLSRFGYEVAERVFGSTPTFLFSVNNDILEKVSKK